MDVHVFGRVDVCMAFFGWEGGEWVGDNDEDEEGWGSRGGGGGDSRVGNEWYRGCGMKAVGC